MAEALQPLLAQLMRQGAPQSGGYSALSIPKYIRHYVGIDEDGSPCLLLYGKPDGTVPGRPLRLQGLSVQYSIPCKLISPGGKTQERTLTTILCRSRDHLERRYFLYAAELLLRIVGREPDLHTVVSATSHLVSIFQKLSQPARKPLTGLIGELLVILRSASPLHAVMAWRSGIDDTFDFSAADLRLEVKAAHTRHRAHYLSYEQCHPPAETVGILVSVVVESTGGGMSLAELLRDIELRLVGRNDALIRLHEVVAATLGQSLAAAMSESFDKELAKDSMQFFDLTEIPAVRGQLPAGVTQVRFRTDLSACRPRPAASFRARSQTARNLLPP